MSLQKRLLVTGGSGLLALNIALHCHKTLDVFLGLHKRKVKPSFASTLYLPRHPTSQDWIKSLSEIMPSYVVNAAAATNIEHCEHNPENAFYVNVQFAERIAYACNHLDIPLVHISTDHLFSGVYPFSTEQTPPDPVNVYGQTKAEAESRVLSVCPSALVIRTNFYGWGTSYRSSFSDKVIQQLSAGNVYNAFSDVYYTPILISDLISAIHHLCELGAKGIFNVVGDQRLSKYDFSLLVAKTFSLESSLLNPISIHEVPTLVQRPKDMSLSNLKATQFLNKGFGSVVDGLLRLKDQSNYDFQKELQQL